MDDSETAEECKPDSTEPCESDAPEYGVIGDEVSFTLPKFSHVPIMKRNIVQFRCYVVALCVSRSHQFPADSH